ncbi:SET domain-containing protein 9 isoform X2 [Mobula hypostoma]|uniref:SET domain-containing protein 9 isoform X2 n=1 Tax=Mobula hypostoma TaxID=723540 RepID=UPI002FC3667D
MRMKGAGEGMITDEGTGERLNSSCGERESSDRGLGERRGSVSGPEKGGPKPGRRNCTPVRTRTSARPGRAGLDCGCRFSAMLQRLLSVWKRYKYRLVPWIALNLGRNARTIRFVPETSLDKIISDSAIEDSLQKLFCALLRGDLSNQTEFLNMLPESIQSKYMDILTHFQSVKETEGNHMDFNPEGAMFETFGFIIRRATSSLSSAGRGVFVTTGKVPKGTLVCMYPGTVYQQYEPILFQSICNPFIFRCIDGVLIDGNDKGISKVIYRSCSGRDRLGPCKTSDVTWLTETPVNPLGVGQYVNNCSNEKEANVCYQEFDVPITFPLELRQYIPNVNYRHDAGRPLRCVVLVALRDIEVGEELFSNYYTIIK